VAEVVGVMVAVVVVDAAAAKAVHAPPDIKFHAF